MQINPEIDYSQKMLSHSSPLMVKIPPVGRNTETLNATSAVGPFEFNIGGNRPIILSKSKLSFDVVIAAHATLANFMSAYGGAYIDRVVLTSNGSNQVLCDVPLVGKYCNSVSQAFTNHSDLMDKSSPLSSTLATAVPPILPATIVVANKEVLKFDDLNLSSALQNIDGNASDCQSPIISARRYYAGAAATASAMSFEFNLSFLKGTILDVEKLLYFSGESLTLSVWFAPINRFGYAATTVGASQAAITGATTLSNVNLYLYTENNGEIANSLVKKVMTEGVSIPIPFAYQNRTANPSPSYTYSQNLSRGWGNRLLVSGFSIYHPTESTGNSYLDNSLTSMFASAGANGVYTNLSYNTTIDGIPVSMNNGISVLGSSQAGEHFTINKENLKNSSYVGLSDYSNKFTHFDNFTGSPLCDIDFTREDGMDLSSQHTYGVSVSGIGGTSAQQNLYTFFITQKTLNLTPSGVQIS